MEPRRQTGTGRKKVQIRPLESKEKRQVCFSKRRTGLFNKVSQLSTMCGVQVAAVAFSVGGKAFSVGHPSVESVLERFDPSNPAEAQAVVAGAAGAGDPNPALEALNRENAELRALLEAEKARKEAAEEAWAQRRAEGTQAAAWLDKFVCQMGEEELVAFAAALEKLHAAVAAHANRMLQQELLLAFTLHGGGAAMMRMPRESMQQHLMMMAMLPPPPGFAARMAMMPQGFWPHGHGFPQ